MKLKLLLTIIFLISALLSYNQNIEYYLSSFDKRDDSLKFELNQIIKDHIEFGYTSSSTDVWDILKQTDKDTANADNVILLYSGRSVDAEQEYNNGSGWNREHVWAKSRGDFGTSAGAGTDVHHLRPCDIEVNETRNNRNFDNCINCMEVIDDGFNTGSKTDANLWTFEPRDEVKGDVARIVFYMTVRYEGEGGEPDLELTNTLLSNTDKSPLHAVMNTLIEWNRIDTVSDWEKNRNEIIYRNFQLNRNPFIDYPELAEYLYGNKIGERWNPTKPTVGIVQAEANFIVYPNPACNYLNIKGDFDSYFIMNKYGQTLITSNSQETISISQLKSGMYFINVVNNEKVLTKKLIKN